MALAPALLHLGSKLEASYGSSTTSEGHDGSDTASRSASASPLGAADMEAVQRDLARYSLQGLALPYEGVHASPKSVLLAPSVVHSRTGSAPPPAVLQLPASQVPDGPKSAPLDQDPQLKDDVERRKHKSIFGGLADELEGGSSAPDSEEVSRTRHRHSRKASFVPGIDIGSAPLSAAPPAERPISVSIRPMSISEHPAAQNGFYEPSPASVALARTNSLSSQGSSAFGFPSLRASAVPIPQANPDHSDPVESFFFPQSPVPPPPQSPGTSTAEDVEADTHPLYALLSKSMAPRLRVAWQAARLVLVPPRETLPADFVDWGLEEDEDEEAAAKWQDWVAAHAFKPMPEDCLEGQEKFTSASQDVFLEATVDTVANEVHLAEASEMASMQQRAASGGQSASPPSVVVRARLAASMPASPPSHSPSPLSTARPNTSIALRRSLPVTSETIIYRQRAAKSSASTVKPASTPTGKKEKRSMKPSRWFRAVSKTKMSHSPSPETTLPPEPVEEPMLDRIKLLSVGGEVLPWLRGAPHAEGQLLHRLAADDDRSLLQDIAFFQDPPDHLLEHESSLRRAFEEATYLVQEFASGFLHVWGYETYTLKRIRSKIMDPVWSEHLSAAARIDASLFQRFENVVMGLCHEHLYTRVILLQHEAKNRYLDTVLAIYRGRPLTLDDFGLMLPISIDLRHAFAILRSLSGSEAFTPLTVDVDHLTTLLGDVDLVAALLRARTPLDLLTRLHRALEALGEAASGPGLTVDDYIPLLSFALVQAEVKDLESLSYYMKSFVQSDLSPELLWSQTTFDAAVAFLRTDPFFAEVSQPPSNAATPSAEMPPFRPDLMLRRVSTMSTATGPVLSVHQTSSPPKRSPSTTSLPSAGTSATSPSASLHHDFQSRVDDALLSPVRSSSGASSLFSRRVQSGRKVPTEIAGGIDVQSRRRLSTSDSRKSSEAMPPPVFPASAGLARNRSTVSMDAKLAEELAARLDEMLPNGPVVLQPPTPEVEIRPQIILRSPALARQPSRSYHMPVDFDLDGSAPARATRAPLGRTQSHHASTSSHGSSTDMRRSRSDGQSKRGSVDAWLLGRSPVSERSTSPRSSSPSSMGPSLERTLSISSEITDHESMWAWNRQRLSSASSSSLISSEGLSRRNSDTEASRTRKNSVSAADILTRLHSSTSAIDTSQPRRSFAVRRQSTLSMSSVESSDTGLSSGTSPASPPTLILSASHRRRQSSSRMRRDLLVSASPLAPRQDNTNVISLPAGHGRYSSWQDSMPSPIKEHHGSPTPSRDSSPRAERLAAFVQAPLSPSEASLSSPPTSPSCE